MPPIGFYRKRSSLQNPQFFNKLSTSMPKTDLPKAYESKDHEDAIYAAWEKSGYFNPDNLSGDPYSIMMPPPNVTGILHLGHALENTIMDTMARFQRMRGKRMLLVPGTDHAALPTQAKVEKMLMKEGMENPRKELGREKLVEKIRAFAEESKSTILSQVRKMGTSCDWSRLAYTFDDQRSQAVNELFVRMYNDGLIYRGYRVVNWSVKGQSTCSDDELAHVEREAKLYTFRYAKDFPITISSTRPETKLGDTAVAVHPSDLRYQDLIGKTFTVDVGAAKPLEIKIIADEEVDPNFGTGALGVTPAHSPIDFAMFERQKAKQDPIGLIPVIGMDGKMTAEAGVAYEGLTAEEARTKFVAWLSAQELLEKEEDIMQSVGTSDRFGDVIEAIPMTQWWLDVNKMIPGREKSLRDLMKEAVTTGLNGDDKKRVTITPDRFIKLYLDRVENLRDWCLSRQVWWGHRIPVWYKEEEIFVGINAPEGEGWNQDPDTLDTWFSSGSWTFSTLGWPKQTKDLADFHPTNWMQMGYEILYLWLMRMILMSAYVFDDIPFKDAYLHGMVRDQYGKKFSKSSDNGLDPIEVIEQYGCDALRISLLIGTSPGNDTKYYTEKIESGRNFTNKLWNIARYVISSVESDTSSESIQPQTLADQWILSRFATVTQDVTGHLEKFEFSQAGEKLRDFTWSEFADWYLEIAKAQRGKDGDQTDQILIKILKDLLKLWHPFMPFVTEVLWKELGDHLLMVESWPVADRSIADKKVEQDFIFLQEVVTGIRNVRAENHLNPKQFIAISILTDAQTRTLLESSKEVILALARVESMDFVETELANAAVTVVGPVRVFIPLAGLIDVAKEQDRLTKELKELDQYLVSVAGKISDADFISKAPAHVVESMREKQTQAMTKRDTLIAQIQALAKS